MGAVRLTKHIREDILARVLNHAFQERAQNMLDAERAFVEEVWNAIYSEAERARMAELPSGWLPEDDDFKVSFDGEVQGLYFRTGLDHSLPHWVKKTYGGGTVEINVPDHGKCDRRMPSAAARGNVLKVLTGEIVKRFSNLQEARAQLEKQYADVYRTAENTLSSVSTVKKLIEVWPEIEAFASHWLDEDSDAKAILPDIPRARLNEQLHLPPA